jgi:hypothetical protein
VAELHLMNTRGRLLRVARRPGLQAAELRMVKAQPSYLLFHPVPFMCGVAYERRVDATALLAGLRGNIFGCLRK